MVIVSLTMSIYTHVEGLFSKPSWTVLPIYAAYDGYICF